MAAGTAQDLNHANDCFSRLCCIFSQINTKFAQSFCWSPGTWQIRHDPGGENRLRAADIFRRETRRIFYLFS
jgi:hypothetical protein